MMKKLVILMVLTALFLSACSGSAQTASAVVETAASDTQSQTGSAETLPEVPLSMRLSLGTIQLEGTENEVTAEQAASLLPLWKLVKSLSESDTTAQAELDAAFAAIQSAMTEEQLQAISSMQLSPRDMFASMQESGSASASGGMTMPEGGGMPGGGMPEGGPPAGGGGGGFQGNPPDMGAGGGNMSPDQIATAQAERQASGAGRQNNGMLYSAVIAYLEGKVNPAVTPTP